MDGSTSPGATLTWLCCPNCGTGFVKRRKGQRYCCKACNHEASRRAAKKRQNLPPPAPSRACPECGRAFAPAHPDQRFCQGACRDASANRWKVVGPMARQALLDRVEKRRPGESAADVRHRKGKALTALGRIARQARDREAAELAAKRGGAA